MTEPWKFVVANDKGKGRKALNLDTIVSIEDYDPDTSFSAALLAAINAADANGGTVQLKTAKTYTATAGTSITDKHVRIDFNGAKVVRSTGMADVPVLTVVHSHSTPQSGRSLLPPGLPSKMTQVVPESRPLICAFHITQPVELYQ